MSLPKILAIMAFILFSTIGTAAMFKHFSKEPSESQPTSAYTAAPIEVELENEIQVVKPIVAKPQDAVVAVVETKPAPEPQPVLTSTPPRESAPLPEANRIQEFFNKGEPKFPFVETIVYKSRVPWQKGRPAWLSDYASYYSTSRHFIARSLNGKADYFKQDVADGDRFNVFKKDGNIEFYLLIDASRCKLWFYAIDRDRNQTTLVKTYKVGLGRLDASKPSGMLTPLGKYSLGNKIAIYKPKMTGVHNGQKVEMIRVFGTRWIPFEKELSSTTAPAKGFGFHGVPWVQKNHGELAEDKSSVGKYESDGCIRLATDDMEEIFAIIITKPSTVELVKDFHDAKIPGVDK